MFEARDKVVKVHAVNMKSKQVKQIFEGPQEEAANKETKGGKESLQRPHL